MKKQLRKLKSSCDCLPILMLLVSLLAIKSRAVAQVTSFTHPGVPFTQADLDQLKSNISSEPWLSAYNALKNDSRSKLDYWMRGPFETVTRAPNLNNDAWKSDMIAIHNLTFMYVFTGDSAYARKATNMLDAWARVNTSWGGNESMLDIGDHVPYFVPAADILRSTFPGWSAANSANVEKYFRDVLYPHSWVPAPLRDHNKGAIMLEIAVGIAAYLGDPERFRQAIEVYRMDAGGGLRNSLPNGEVGDSGRDDHWWVQIQALGWSAEVAWKQGIDLFAEFDNRLLAMAELYHKYSLSPEGTVPFIPFGGYSAYYVNWGIPPGFRRHSPFNNIIENAYARRKGIATPYTTQMRNLMGENSWSFLYLKSSDNSQATALTPIVYPGDNAVAVSSMSNLDIGNPGIEGSANYADGKWLVKAAGNSLSNAVNFTFRRVKGDVAIVVKVDNTSLSSSNCGIMLRESLAANSRYVSIGIAATGGVSASHYRPKIPWWFKLERVGDRIFTYHSQDGINWTNLALTRQTFSDSYIGFYTLSNNTSALNTATFSDLKITTGSVAGAAEITSPTLAGATLNTAFSYAVTASESPAVFHASGLPAGLSIDSLSGVISGTPGLIGRYPVNLELINAADTSYATLIINVSSDVAPDVPANVAAAVNNTTRIAVSWTAVAGAGSYTVKRSLSADGPFEPLQQGLTATSFIDEKPSPEVDNFYVVSALAGTLESGNSAVVFASVPPTIPSLPQVVNKPAQIDLKWQPASGALSYNLKRASLSGGPYTTIATISDTSYSDTGVAVGSPYYYVISSMGATKESANSAEAFGVAGATAVSWSPTPITDSLKLAANWIENISPLNPAIITFSGSADSVLTNDITGLEASRIRFAEGSPSYTIAGDTIRLKNDLLNNSSASQTINNPLIISDQFYVNNGPGSVFLNGLISGNGGLTRSGRGTLFISGTNTYSGNTTINGTTGGWPPVNAIAISGAGTGSPSAPTSGPLGTGKIIMNGGSLFSTTNATLYNDIEVRNERRSFIYQTSAAISLRGRLLGNGTIEQDGNTTAGLHLYGDNSEFEGTFISKLRSGNSRTRFETPQAGSAKAFWLLDNTGNDTQSLQFSSGTINFGALSGRGAIRCNGGGNPVMSVGALNLNTTFSGNISNVNGSVMHFEKVGTGTLILSGNSSYSGNTTVKKGKLLLNNNASTGTFTSRVIVEEGTFGGTGRSTASATIGTGAGAGAVLEPGNSGVGSLTVASLILKGDASYTVEIQPAGSADKITAGTVELTDKPTLALSVATGELPEGAAFTIIDNTGSQAIRGGFKDLSEMSLISTDSYNFRITYKGGTGNDVQLLDDRTVPVVITSDLADTTLVGRPYSYAITAIKSPTVFTATGLPAGLTIDGSTGVISGTPTEYGAFPLTLIASNESTADTAILNLSVMNTVVADVAVAEGDSRLVLEWSAIPNFSYIVRRSTSSGGPYTDLATQSGNRFVDAGLSNGSTYYYVIAGVENATEYPNSGEIVGTPVLGQHTRLSFEESSGSVATDNWGAYHATLQPGVKRASGIVGNGIVLDGTSASYATLPAGVLSSLNDFSISTWIKMDVKSNWMRVFDFGSGTSTYMFLTIQAGSSNIMRYAIRNNNSSEQQVSYTYSLPLATWTHFVITQSGNTCRMYINGSLVATNSNVSLKPSVLGNTSSNYIGKSQYNDPLFKGSIDEFKIFSRALSATEVADLASTATLPVSLIDYRAKLQAPGLSVLNWQTASEEGNEYFIVERSNNGRDFLRIGNTLLSKGKNGGYYSFTDQYPQPGDNYYRLSQANGDGTVKVLGTRVVNVSLDENSFAVYPNPVTGNSFTFNIPQSAEAALVVKITGLSGNTIYSATLARRSDGLYKVQFGERPPAGVYVLSAGKYVSKIIIR